MGPAAGPQRAVTALLAVLLVAAAASGCGAGVSRQVKVGEPAPPIVGTTLDGTPFDLAALRGRPVLVNFWASWCGPCRDEFPLFKERLSAHAADGFAIVGVLYKDEASLAQAFATEFGVDWPTVIDAGGALAAGYRVVAPPQSYFVDRAGVVRSIQIGEVRREDFERQYAAIAR